MSDETATVTTTEARKIFADIINRVKYGRTRIVLERRKKAVAIIVPVEDMELLQELEDRFDLDEARLVMEEYDKTGEATTLDDYRMKRGL